MIDPSHRDAPPPGDDRPATELLRIALAGPRRPVDDAVERLAGAGEWFDACVARAWSHEMPLAAPPRMSLAALQEAKERAKRQMADAATREEASGAVVGYFVTIAATLVQHGVLISNQPPRRLAEAMQDLATVAPAAWGDLFMEAALRLEEDEQSVEDPSSRR